jgi:hypothetical protein
VLENARQRRDERVGGNAVELIQRVLHRLHAASPR